MFSMREIDDLLPLELIINTTELQDSDKIQKYLKIRKK